jgi:glutamate synthase (NADPH/NADH) small chain
LDNNIEAAGALLFSNNPLSLICSYICPQESQCEGHCVLGIKGTPVQISEIEQYISDYYLNVYKPQRDCEESKGKVAVIGSGPAGITISFLLAKKGYDVTIFEGNERIGGVMWFVPTRRSARTLPSTICNGTDSNPSSSARACGGPANSA